MTTSRVTPKRAPVSPGRDSRFTLRRHPDGVSGWWVHYEPTGADPIPADDAHVDLVELINFLKQSEGTGLGGGFSITEHSQVIARMSPSGGQSGQKAIHVIGLQNGVIVGYTPKITFLGGTLDPTKAHTEGDLWSGPLCGTSYTFSAPNAPRAPYHKLDEIKIEVNGASVFLSSQIGAVSYPPTTGPLANFLSALRRVLPGGGRFRVNEHGRAFSSDEKRFIGVIPKGQWFHPISPTD